MQSVICNKCDTKYQPEYDFDVMSTCPFCGCCIMGLSDKEIPGLSARIAILLKKKKNKEIPMVPGSELSNTIINISIRLKTIIEVA